MKFLIVNGPNINMLGVREPDIYGTLTYEGLCDTIAQAARGMGVEVEFFQSNSEGGIVTAIQNALGRMDGIVINPAAYTHTSVAILDALKAVALPAAEVHISDVTKREAFRQRSFAGMACRYHFVGEGRDGYVHALETLKRDIEGSLIILHAMPRSEWEACRAAGAVGGPFAGGRLFALFARGIFLACGPGPLCRRRRLCAFVHRREKGARARQMGGRAPQPQPVLPAHLRRVPRFGRHGRAAPAHGQPRAVPQEPGAFRL